MEENGLMAMPGKIRCQILEFFDRTLCDERRIMRAALSTTFSPAACALVSAKGRIGKWRNGKRRCRVPSVPNWQTSPRSVSKL